jgi:signal transduction histidine kinase/CheY-like chemotaxis protein
MKAFWNWHEERVLVEQLRLMLSNVRDSFVFGVPGIFILVWLLYVPQKSLSLLMWASATLSMQSLRAWHAHQLLKTNLAARPVHRIAWETVGLNLMTGAFMGGLYWVASGQTSVTERLLINASMFLIITSVVTMLSPFLPAFVAFIGSITCVMFLRRWTDNSDAYGLPPGAPIFVGFVLFMHARNLANGVSRTIAIRFENQSLMAQVREETRKANEAHEEAVQANEGKTRFLAAASHDLRQPMHALGLFLSLLGRSPLDDRQQGFLNNARAMSDATTAMLSTLLDYSRLEAGAVSPQARAFRLQPLLYKLEGELATQANAKGLVYRTRETQATVMSDPALVEMMLRNLVSNAIRYTTRGGVLVACRTRGGTLWLEVWDTGIGIAPAQQAEIFREFHQLNNPERDRERGLGLGLAIVDGMARTLGHTLQLASHPGRGSVFRLGLPIARVAVVTDAFESLPALPLPPDGLQRPTLHVLVIDDDAAVRAGMQQLLQDWGCPCDVVESQEQALQCAQARRPDFIISDYRLRAGRTGAEAIAALRHALGSEVPALLVTGDTAPDRLREAIATGIPLLHKPVSPAELRRRIALE